jgi:hypothetical protein
MSSEDEFYKEYYKYFSGDNNNVYQFKKKAEKAEKRLKFGTGGAVFDYSAFDKGTMSLNFNFKLSNDFIDKLDRRIDRIQKALEDIRNDLRRSEDF